MTSPYLELAERIDADIKACWLLCHHLGKLNKKLAMFYPINNPSLIWWIVPNKWNGNNIRGNQQRIIALLFIHEMFLDELKKKKK